MDNNSLTHTKWDCKYHLALAPKYRRQIIYKDIKVDAGQILGTLCRRKGIGIIEAQCTTDYIHMLVSIPPKYSVSEVVASVCEWHGTGDSTTLHESYIKEHLLSTP